MTQRVSIFLFFWGQVCLLNKLCVSVPMSLLLLLFLFVFVLSSSSTLVLLLTVPEMYLFVIFISVSMLFLTEGLLQTNPKKVASVYMQYFSLFCCGLLPD